MNIFLHLFLWWRKWALLTWQRRTPASQEAAGVRLDRKASVSYWGPAGSLWHHLESQVNTYYKKVLSKWWNTLNVGHHHMTEELGCWTGCSAQTFFPAGVGVRFTASVVPDQLPAAVIRTWVLIISNPITLLYKQTCSHYWNSSCFI